MFWLNDGSFGQNSKERVWRDYAKVKEKWWLKRLRHLPMLASAFVTNSHMKHTRHSIYGVFDMALEKNFKSKLARAIQTQRLQSCKLYGVWRDTIQIFGVPFFATLKSFKNIPNMEFWSKATLEWSRAIPKHPLKEQTWLATWLWAVTGGGGHVTPHSGNMNLIVKSFGT